MVGDFLAFAMRCIMKVPTMKLCVPPQACKFSAEPFSVKTLASNLGDLELQKNPVLTTLTHPLLVRWNPFCILELSYICSVPGAKV
jgi:hypothetical protein